MANLKWKSGALATPTQRNTTRIYKRFDRQCTMYGLFTSTFPDSNEPVLRPPLKMERE